MSVIRRIQRLYRPVTDPMYTRNDIEVDSRTLLDPNVPKDELPGGEPENITDVPVLDQTPLESIMESHNKYNKPDFHVHVNEIKHPEKDKVPEDRPESLLKTQDSGSEIDDTLETDDNYRPQYVPSAVVSYYNESANGGKLIERRKGPGGNYIWVAESPDRVHWGRHICIATTRPGKWDSARVGAGAAPIRTEKGWLEIYHGANKENRYCLGALLLDLDDPTKVIARSEEPIMEPIAPYEQTGFFGNVVFTNGFYLIDEDTVRIFYGASDEVICSAEFSIKEILDTLCK